MSQSFELKAETRESLGKSASRRLRRVGRVPAVLYGAGKTPQSLTLCHNALSTALRHERFYSSIITIDVAGQTQKAVLKDLQRHPFKPKISHADFQRINENEAITVNVPLHFIGETTAPGVKVSGGLVSHLKNEVEISCLPKHLPEFIEVNLSSLAIGESIHLSELTLPEGVRITHLTPGGDNDFAVVNIHMPKGTHTEDTNETENADKKA